MKGLLETLLSWGPLGLLLFAVADGVGVPTPGGLDALLILLCAHAPSQAYGFAGLALLGSLIGCLTLFWMARKGGEAVLKPYRERPRFARFERWFQHYGLLTVFIPALVPIPMPLKFFILCAGALEVTPVAFFFTLLAARAPRYIGLAYLGSKGHTLGWFTGHIWELTASAAVLFVFLYALIKIIDCRRASAPGARAVDEHRPNTQSR
jgi:membrane protein YqaA with SNARE-associated domain